MMDVNLLNKSLSEYLDDDTELDFRFIKSLNDIIIRNTKDREIPIYLKRISLKDASSLVYKFLKSINGEYAEYFKAKYEAGIFQFDNTCNRARSFYDDTAGRSCISMPIFGCIVDSYTMLHETMHDMNQDISNVNLCRELITEMISLLSEMLFHKFLINEKLVIHDNRKMMIYNIGIIYDIAWSTDLELALITEYLKKGYVDNKFIKGLYYKYDGFIIDHMIDEEYIFKNDFYLKYIIGAVLSFYVYDRIQQNPKFIKEYFEINGMMNIVNFEDILTYLDLDYIVDRNDNINLMPATLEKLEKSYKKVLKEF